MMKKINLGLVFGGRSAEHEISLQSTYNVLQHLDRRTYAITLLGIDKEGTWHLYEEMTFLENAEDPEKITLSLLKNDIDPLLKLAELDVVFPLLHGPCGEDGTVQGLFKLAKIPFVGADVLGSAVGMDKDMMKRLLRDSALQTAHFLSFVKTTPPSFEQVAEELSLPFFVKPANMGSSIGISKVKSKEEFTVAVEEAFCFDRKILIEEGLNAREIQCSVLGNEEILVSKPCEIIPHGEFHSYSSKYIDKEGAEFLIPAPLTKEEVARIQEVAKKAYKALCCEGFARVDFFLKEDGEIFVSEINTIPGLTKMSPYLLMWEASGLTPDVVLDRLITLAKERFDEQEALLTSYAMEKL